MYKISNEGVVGTTKNTYNAQNSGNSSTRDLPNAQQRADMNETDFVL